MKLAVNIVIADDHDIFRDGFKVLLKDQEDVVLIGEATNGRALLALVTKIQPDIVITDIKMPEMSGIEVCKHIRNEFPHMQVIALSMFNDDHLIVDMLEAGASGYLLKNTKRQELLDAVQVVYKGGNYYSPATSAKLTKLIGRSKFNPWKNETVVKLNKQEKDIIRLICEQRTSKEIAAELNLAFKTVESYRETLLLKTNSQNMIGIALYAIKHGLYTLPE